MKQTFILLTICCALFACKKIDVTYDYSPAAPRAGEAVSFSNLSNGGEEWAWTFGDGATSTIKSPSHTYKQPGTYQVTLKVDNKNSLTCTKQITIYDTIPTFVMSDSVFTIYKDYTFTANLYNPYNFPVSYRWTVDGEEKGTDNTLTTYFTQVKKTKVALRVTVNNSETTDIEKELSVSDTETNSVYFRTAAGDYRQRIFGARSEDPKPTTDTTVFADAQDTLQVYNGKTFRLSELKAVFPAIEGFKIANRKIYFRASGLWVAALDGTNLVQIETEACPAMNLDMVDNRIYWAVANEVRYMPQVGAENNRFVTEPQTINTLMGVTCIVSDNIE